MPPKKGTKPPLENLLRQIVAEELHKALAPILARLDQLSPSQASTHLPSLASSLPTLSAVTAAVHSALSDPDTDRRQRRAVLGGIEEKGTDDETNQSDKTLIHSLISSPHHLVTSPLSFLHTISGSLHESITITRLGKANPKFPRLLAVDFQSKEQRNSFVKACELRDFFKQHVTNPHSFCRVDYTPEQVEEDRKLRISAGKKNSECGKLKFVVRNMRIVEISNPRDLPQRSIDSLNRSKTNPSLKFRSDSSSAAPRKLSVSGATLRPMGADDDQTSKRRAPTTGDASMMDTDVLDRGGSVSGGNSSGALPPVIAPK